MQQNNTYKTLNILFLAFLAGQIVFALIFLFVVKPPEVVDNTSSFSSILLLLSICLSVAGIFGGNVLYKKTVEKALIQPTAEQKLETYRGGLIMKYAMLEGPCLLAIIAYFLTGNMQFMYMAGLLIIIFIINKPSKDKIATELQLSGQEVQNHLY